MPLKGFRQKEKYKHVIIIITLIIFFLFPLIVLKMWVFWGDPFTLHNKCLFFVKFFFSSVCRVGGA